MLPVGHVGHYLWVLYLIPVAIVVAGIVKSTRAQGRTPDKKAEEEH